MRAFIPMLAFLSVAAAGGDKEHAMMKKWAWGKAMASCVGEENYKYYMKEFKMHAAECRGVPAPELELPFFNTPFRTASSLMNGAMSERNSDFPQELFYKFMKEEMMKKFSRSKYHRHRDHDEEDDMPFRKSSYRYRRDSDDEQEDKPTTDVLDLGDRLIEKLAHIKDEMASKIGNYTCMLQKCGIINEDMDLQLDNMISFFDKLPQPLDPWLKERMIDDKKRCYDFAEAIPSSFYENCSYGPKLGKIKMFKKCCKATKAKTCMAYDIKQNLEENFGDVEDLMEESKLEENELFTLVQALMDVDM